MATFGAQYPNFAPWAETQPETGLPAFGARVVIGRLVSANVTVALATGDLYADDVLAEHVSEFASASCAMETDDMLDAVAAVVYGATVETQQVHYKAGDATPQGGLAYYKVLMRNGTKVYKGFFYPKVMAALGNDSAQTKGSSVTFGTASTTFTIQAHTATDDWRITAEFPDVAAVRAWVEEMLTTTTTP